MTLLKTTIVGLLILVVASCALSDTVVFQEDFSAPFVHHDWYYNNSGDSSTYGYPGIVGGVSQQWPAHVSEDGREILGYTPKTFYATTFEEFAIGPLAGQDPRGWVGTGTICSACYSPSKGIRFTNESAYRNFTPDTPRSVQFAQCYVKSSSTYGVSYIYAGTENLAGVAAVVRLNNNGQIEALNGNGSGGGTWVTLAPYLQDEWRRITIKLDYSNGTYRAAVQGGYFNGDLGFRDSAAGTGLGAVVYAETVGGTFYVDDVYAGDSPFAPGQDGHGYWYQWKYNKSCMEYGKPIDIAELDIYDWMSCTDLAGNPVNTDPDKAAPFKASLPQGWTAAFGAWADEEPQVCNDWRGKMGFTRLKGAYAQPGQPDNPCLHIWSSHGDLRVVSPNIPTGPGVYTLSWKGSVWNLNTADPTMQYRWTDWCSVGCGYTNWCAWDQWNPNDGYLQTIPPYPLSMNWMGISEYWTWLDAPFLRVHPPITNDPPDPPDYLSNRPIQPHPAGEEPGQWHSFTNTIAFGLCPDELPTTIGPGGKYPGRGYYIGFRVGHSHGASNPAAAGGYQWGTILNVDDIVLTKKDPVAVDAARTSLVGTLVEVADLVVVNMAVARDNYGGVKYVDVFLEKRDRSGGILLRASRPEDIARLYDDSAQQFAFERGDACRVIGAISKDDPYYTALPQPDTRNPVGYLSSWLAGSRLPAVVPTGETGIDIKPVAVSNKALAQSSLDTGASAEGMLVTVFGRVNNSTYYYCYVDDGTGLDAGKPKASSTTRAKGIRIDCRALEFDPFFAGCPSNGKYVAVTGTYATEMNAVDHTTVVHVVYPRPTNPYTGMSDFVVFPE